MTFGKCLQCGVYHYTFRDWSIKHGQMKPFFDPYVQKPFLLNGEPWDEKEYNPENPYPTITWKWVCKFCEVGNNNHTSDCDYYLEYIKRWEDIKGGVHSTTYTSTSSTSTSTGTKPPKKEDETEIKKTLSEWSKDRNKITPFQYKQLYKIVDLKKEYTLTELLSYLPKKKPKPTPTPTPDNTRPPTPEPIDPLITAINNVEKELNGGDGLFGKYYELAPLFFPETEINDFGNEEDYWEEESWLEYLQNSKDLNDLNNRKDLVLKVFGHVVIEHYLIQSNLKKIDKFKSEHPKLYPTTLNDRVEQLRKKQTESKLNWDEVLDKIYNKFNGSDKPKNLTQVKEFIEKDLKTLPKSGIEGDIQQLEAKKEDLLKLKKGSSNMSLSGGKGEIKDFSTWTALDSNRDGNCFLNSFSLLMKGDQTLATELRVRLCLYLMNKPELIGGFTDAEKLQALTLKLTGERDRDGKVWTLAKRGQWLATDDIGFFSDMLQRPIRVLYKPNPTQFKDYEAPLNFSKITGGWGKLEYYEPDTKTYKKTDYWTICHVSSNHFEPLISPNEDKALPPTEINTIFTKLINGVRSVIRGEVPQSNYLMLNDFENQLALLDNSYRKEIKNRIKQVIFGVIGLEKPINEEQYEKLPIKVKVMVDKLLEINNSYKNKEIDIYFEAIDAFTSGSLMITVAPRPNGETHTIGDNWKNEEEMINVYVEKPDPQPKEYKGKELKRVFLDLPDAEKKQKEKEIKEKGYNHLIYHVRGKVRGYDDGIKSLTFEKGAEIEIEILLPL